jgi:hypothetical protein
VLVALVFAAWRCLVRCPHRRACSSPWSLRSFVGLVVAACSLRSSPSDAASPLVVAPVALVALVFAACHRTRSSLSSSRSFIAARRRDCWSSSLLPLVRRARRRWMLRRRWSSHNIPPRQRLPINQHIPLPRSVVAVVDC